MASSKRCWPSGDSRISGMPGSPLEEAGDREAEAGEQGRGERVVALQRGHEAEPRVLAAVDGDGLRGRVHDPVLLDAIDRVLAQLALAVAALVGGPGGEDLHH